MLEEAVSIPVGDGITLEGRHGRSQGRGQIGSGRPGANNDFTY